LTIKELHKNWLELGQKYCYDLSFLESIWQKIEKNYSSQSRYYHNLHHIQSMINLAYENSSEIKDFDELLFAIWFHDIIYSSTSKKNEEKSANFFDELLKGFNFKELKKEKIYQLIMSTKAHKILVEKDSDNSFLLDFDLSILGQNWNIYQKYIQDIRKEYKIYPDFLYNPSRKKVLESFLGREKLYFTKKYQNLFEKVARENLQKELMLLN